jgi:hypothetical protein
MSDALLSLECATHAPIATKKQTNKTKYKTQEANANVKIEGTSEAFSSAHFTLPSIRNRESR